jgi:hypothetical protein
LLELNAIEKTLDAARDRVCFHDEDGVSSVWVYLLVTEPFAWPTSAAIVTSVDPTSFAMLAKL